MQLLLWRLLRRCKCRRAHPSVAAHLDAEGRAGGAGTSAGVGQGRKGADRRWTLLLLLRGLRSIDRRRRCGRIGDGRNRCPSSARLRSLHELLRRHLLLLLLLRLHALRRRLSPLGLRLAFHRNLALVRGRARVERLRRTLVRLLLLLRRRRLLGTLIGLLRSLMLLLRW